jgi:adenylate cyclase
MGDAIMAFFGAPISFSDHAKFACRCALNQQTKLMELKEEFRKLGLPEIDMGIGLNTGEASVGNMGSQTVRNYTVMGDTVNLGSRLEGLTKEYGIRIALSETTYKAVKDHFFCRPLDLVRVKGKNIPIRIFELVCEGQPKENERLFTARFESGLEKYLQKKWLEAIDDFNSCLGERPQDRPSQIFIERCLEFQSHPPPENWDGVFVMTTK